VKPAWLIAVGASAGGFEPLKLLVQKVPRGLPAAILIVLHTTSHGSGALAGLLDRASRLNATYPASDTPLESGTIYVAPPDHHLLVADSHVRALRGPRENGFRPAIDPLFRSAARSYGQRVIGVILSGAMDDGSSGLRSIKDAGGVAIVQHPDEAMVPGMPPSAIRQVEVDFVLPVAEIPEVLVRLVQNNGNGSGGGQTPMSKEPASYKSGPAGSAGSIAADPLQGPPSTYTCPECGGTLWELQDGGSFRFRCHTGHGFTPESLLDGQGRELEHALWSAVRVLKERAGIHEQLAIRMQSNGLKDLATKYHERAEEERKKSLLIEGILSQTKTG
jgi:two-component system chemotaxis response regulator CheB